MIRTGLVGLLGLGTGIALSETYRRTDGLSSAPTLHLIQRAFAAKPIDPQIQTKSSQRTEVFTPDKQLATDSTSTAPEVWPPKQSGRIAEIARHGFPSLDTIRSFDNFILSYDRRNRTANWVLEHLNKDQISGDRIDRTNVQFFEDKTIHEYFRSTNSDYKASGYDRGHLAAAGNHRRDPRLVAQTFVLSNISPQVGKGFNRDIWNQLEKYCRWRGRHSDNVWVCTGPLYLPKRNQQNGRMYVTYEVIGKNHVSVPTHFFKVLVIENKGVYDLEAYVLPNCATDDKTPLESFRVPIDTIERAAGLLFFERIPRSSFRTINGK